ncbi:substrate-binding periplasmic protein [Rhodoferax aquaticus]|uniref:Transporter substrate-binding domain-containing protein n=1 Tax=Rhodoferax aquaticus TaxID=2527691 RepID=A0A515ET35_9BURK|nr:transporter substrate-binding domain-containing protein [Rhodoferax aquaticus]QDL55723.1 transporter substrate-binding domain-containing protein [Rhodoferax aquaticus]
MPVFNRFRHLLSVCLAGLSMGVAAAPTELYCSRPIRVALFEFGLMYRQAAGDGIDARMLDAIAKRTGCAFVQVVLPRNRIWAELQAGTLDLATAAIPTPERKEYGFLLPYMKTRNLFLLDRHIASKASTLEQFEAGNYRLGVVRGFRHEMAYDSLIARLAKQGRVIESADVNELFKLLDRGVVSGILSQPLVFNAYYAEKQLKAKVVIHDWTPADQFSVGTLILARKTFTPEQAKQWDALVSDMLRDGTLLKINSQYLPTAQARDLLYTGPRTPD